jgi:hypothetical protein
MCHKVGRQHICTACINLPSVICNTAHRQSISHYSVWISFTYFCLISTYTCYYTETYLSRSPYCACLRYVLFPLFILLLLIGVVVLFLLGYGPCCSWIYSSTEQLKIDNSSAIYLLQTWLQILLVCCCSQTGRSLTALGTVAKKPRSRIKALVAISTVGRIQTRQS